MHSILCLWEDRSLLEAIQGLTEGLVEFRLEVFHGLIEEESSRSVPGLNGFSHEIIIDLIRDEPGHACLGFLLDLLPDPANGAKPATDLVKFIEWLGNDSASCGCSLTARWSSRLLLGHGLLGLDAAIGEATVHHRSVCSP